MTTTTPVVYSIFQHYLFNLFNMESRHLPNSSVQNALNCISENFKVKNFSGGACARNSLKKVRRSQSWWALLPLYTISLDPLYNKILRPALNTGVFLDIVTVTIRETNNVHYIEFRPRNWTVSLYCYSLYFTATLWGNSTWYCHGTNLPDFKDIVYSR